MKAPFLPQNLDDQMMILMWSADELLPGFAVFLVGIFFDQRLLGLAAAIIITKIYKRSKEGSHDGHLVHFCYYYGLLKAKGTGFPCSHEREYIP
jgi:type IV conjugative transfer system protein TraL